MNLDKFLKVNGVLLHNWKEIWVFFYIKFVSIFFLVSTIYTNLFKFSWLLEKVGLDGSYIVYLLLKDCSLSFASKSAMKSHSRSKHCTQKIIE